jgi:hypothetical protein
LEQRLTLLLNIQQGGFCSKVVVAHEDDAKMITYLGKKLEETL